VDTALKIFAFTELASMVLVSRRIFQYVREQKTVV